MAISFGLWIVAGAATARGSTKLREHAFSLSRTSRALRSALLFAASPLGIFIPFYVVWNSGGQRQDVLLPWVWLLVTVGGLACVGTATLGLAYAVSLAMEAARLSQVTTRGAAASSREDSSDR
jgi:hypothetical protein